MICPLPDLKVYFYSAVFFFFFVIITAPTATTAAAAIPMTIHTLPSERVEAAGEISLYLTLTLRTY